MSNTTFRRTTDLSTLATEDIIDEYDRIWTAYQELKTADEQYRQEIHGLKRALNTATNAESYLSAELDTIDSAHRNEIAELQQKHRDELDDARDKCARHQDNVAELEADVDRMRQQIDGLQKELHEMQLAFADSAGQQPNVGGTVTELEQLLIAAERENAEFTVVVEGLREQLTKEKKLIIQHEVCVCVFSLTYFVVFFFFFDRPKSKICKINWNVRRQRCKRNARNWTRKPNCSK